MKIYIIILSAILAGSIPVNGQVNITPGGQAVPANGGTYTAKLPNIAVAHYVSIPDASWIHISDSIKSNTIHYSVDANTSLNSRAGEINIIDRASGTSLFSIKVSQTTTAGHWQMLNNAPPHTETLCMLLTDGTVLAFANDYSSVDKLTPDSTGSYVNGTWTSLPNMNFTRSAFSSQVLPSGKLYVAGGESGTGVNKSEIYDPVVNTWTNGDSMPPSWSIIDMPSKLLTDGRVLQAGYGPGNGTFFFDPATLTYSSPIYTHEWFDESTWVILPDNSILYVDFQPSPGNIDSGDSHSERYIPALDQWILDNPLNTAIHWNGEVGGAALLPNGKVLFLGATFHNITYTPSGNTSPGTWTPGPDLPDSLGCPDAPCAMMCNGKVLINASHYSYGDSAATWYPSPSYMLEYDYVTDSFTYVSVPGGGDTLNLPTTTQTFLNLPDGSILCVSEGFSVPYVYVPFGAVTTAGMPIVDSIIPVDCAHYKATGKLFTGISEGSIFGDENQNQTNYPLVRLSAGSHVYYARTTNWNRPGTVCNGTLPDTTDFTLPAGLPDGTYALEVVVNGIPSAPVTFTKDSGSHVYGLTTLAVGASVTLSTTTEGGTWSSSNGNVHVAGGLATGVTNGMDTIYHAFTNGCGTFTDTFYIEIYRLSVSNPALVDQLSVFPNPTNGLLNITNIHATNGCMEVKLLNFLGATMYNNRIEFCAGKAQLDIKDIAPAGIYLLCIYDFNGVMNTFRVALEK